MDFTSSPLFANLLYLLLVAGLWLAALAIVSPGTGVLEVLAFFALAGVGLGTLYFPLNIWAAVVLLVGLGFLFLALRLQHEELWLGLSALAFILGSIFLFRLESGSPAVHPLLALVISILNLGFFWIALRSAVSAHRSRPTFDPTRVIGMVGEVRTPLTPTGSVYIGGELWTARAEVPLENGVKVRVRAREGLILLVEEVQAPLNEGE